jgi:mevalonate kinase
MTRAHALGKIILVGEHAVVYGRPAIAVPLPALRATVDLETRPEGPAGEIWIDAPDIRYSARLSETASDDPLARILRLVREDLSLLDHPPLGLTVTSTIPVASGLGSGAAVSVAIARAMAAHFRRPLSTRRLSELAFEVEKIHHGTPSGIDNTVIAYEKPVYFVRDRPLEVFRIPVPFHLLVADSGRPSSTAQAVAAVRQDWQRRRGRYEGLFDEVGRIVRAARPAIESGRIETLGPLLDRNQAILAAMGLVTPTLAEMRAAAKAAGAQGAKISGAGMGGNLIALVRPIDADRVARALIGAGAAWVILTEVRG